MRLGWEPLTAVQIEDMVAMALGREPDETLDHDVHGPYLEKWLIERRADGSARYVHRFLRPDADNEEHDHPWDNRTICVENGYFEDRPEGRRWIGPGEIVERRATDFHRVSFETGRLPISIFEHGPKYNAWGFRGRNGEKIPWRDFCAETGTFRR